MESQVKALLLGISVRRKTTHSVSGVAVAGAKTARSKEEREAIAKALERVEIDVSSIEPGEISQWLSNPESITDWLITHPEDKVIVGRYSIIIESPIDMFGTLNCPFEVSAAIEDFRVDEIGPNGFVAEWSFC
jgi:hypothetical protein